VSQYNNAHSSFGTLFSDAKDLGEFPMQLLRAKYESGKKNCNLNLVLGHIKC